MNGVSVRDIFERMMENVSRKIPGARINGISVQRMARQTRGRELYIGMVTDEPFGPVIAFGAGGNTVQVVFAPLHGAAPTQPVPGTADDQQSAVAHTLDAWRVANPVNHEALEQVLLRVSENGVRVAATA